MGGSIKIGNVFGIPVRIHWTFLVLAWVLLLVVPGSSVERLAGFVAVFGAVFLHELGHSLVARRFGIHVLDITFWPLGGMARMSEMPEDSRVEGLVAIAGPAVNFLLAALSLPLLLAGSLLQLGGLVAMTAWFLGVNLVIGTFNLVPAFPMDGGRLLRAWFARRDDWLAATERAVRVGRVCAALMFLIAIVTIFEGGSCALPLIAIFVWFAGARELMSVRMRHGVGPFGLEGALGTSPPQAGRPTWHVRTEPRGGRDDDEAATAGARRPRVWRHGDVPRGGFTEVDLRDLEDFHGRLRDGDRE